jgi:site-specific recombinase XerD
MPTGIFGTVDAPAPTERPKPARPVKPRNQDVRPREYLSEAEVDQLCKAAQKHGRYGHRDAAMILIAYRHGLRVSELVALRCDQIDFALGHLQVRRLKGGIDSVHPLSGREVRALRRLKRESAPDARFVFLTERGGPMTANSFGRMLTRTAESIDFPLKVHPHMLRHGVGFKLANAGHDTRAIQHYLGHKDIKHTVRYTELAPTRFNGFWKD